MTALSMIVTALEAASAAPIVEYRANRFSGAALLGRIRARANDLFAAGVRDRDTALIIVADNLSAIEQLVACWMIGASACLVDFRSTPARLAEWTERLSPRMVIATRPMPGVALHVQPRDPDPAINLEFASTPDPDRVAVHIASSGSTGLPTLRERRQGQLGGYMREGIEDLFLDRSGAALSPLSVGYSASLWLWLLALAAGKPILALDLVHRLDELDAALKRRDVTECALAPTLVRRLAALPGTSPRYPNLLRLTAVGGPALPEDKIAAVSRLTPHFRMVYSCAGVGLIARICGAEILERPASCGKPVDGVKVIIRDGERVCGPGEIGEIAVTTRWVTEIRPGDRGWLDEAGYLFIAGRVQGLICRNGVNFSADRLTTVALRLPEITEAAVIAVPDADGGDAVHLVVQAPGTIADALAQALRQSLPVAEQPDRIHVRGSIPLTPAGKVDLRALAKDIRSGDPGARGR